MILGALAAGSRSGGAQGEHRWGGLLFDAFAREASGGGVEAWTAEDGGRIRYRDPSTGDWSFQDVPDEVQDTLHRVFFLPGYDTGWAVGQGGWVLKTTNGGTTWSTIGDRILNQGPSEDIYEELFDIHFLSTSEGYMIGMHSIWYSSNGGSDWLDLGDPYNEVLDENFPLSTEKVELYSIDVQIRSDGSRLALIVGQPGVVIRCEKPSNDPELDDWRIWWDVESLCAVEPCGGSTSELSECACDICPIGEVHTGPWFEAWDVEIGRNDSEDLALFVGGVGAQCGMIFASTDEGMDWAPEWHECACTGTGCIDCTTDDDYNDDAGNALDLNRLKSFRTIYGLGMFDDNSAVAAAYNGQHLVRDPSTGVWQDRSSFAAGVPTVPNSVIFPLIGAAAVDLPESDKFGVITGEGGHLRESTDGGQTWTDEAVGEPHRIDDIFFVDSQAGWHLGQFYRIAKTLDGGIHWEDQVPAPTASAQGRLRALTFAATSTAEGVAVGDAYYPGGSFMLTTSIPKLRYTDSTQQISGEWTDTTQIQNLGNSTLAAYLDGKGLREVTWVSGTQFWAVGAGGLILKSLNGGQNWSLVAPESLSTLSNFEMEGVAFQDASTGLIVGRRPNSSSVIEGAVFQYRDSGSVSWTSLSMPSGLTITGLTDVAIASSTAWIVGEKLVGGSKEGVVLTASWSGTGFGSLSEVTPTSTVPLCLTGNDPYGQAILTEVEVAPNTGEVWIGGACGRVWFRSGSGSWSEIQSQTDAHVVGMSFVPDGSGAVGFIAGFRASQTQQCITSIQ